MMRDGRGSRGDTVVPILKRLWHLPWLLASLIGSLLILIKFTPFAGMGMGVLIDFLLGSVVTAHMVAAIVGAFLIQQGRSRLAIVLSVALFPATMLLLFRSWDAYHLRYVAVYDRFRDNLMNPIPDSVSDLKFVSFHEKGESHLMFRFEIDPDDLEKIIQCKGFKRIDKTQFRRWNDLFTDTRYLPLEEPVAFYIFEDLDGGYKDLGIGEGYTLKVSADRTHVIFRRESAAYYRYKHWAHEPPENR